MSKFITLALASVLVASCATPPSALDQANNTVSLIEGLSAELARYRANAALMQEQRAATTAFDNEYILRVSETMAVLDTARRKAAGFERQLALEANLRDLSRARTQATADSDQARKDLVQALSQISKPLPSADAKLAAAEKAMAALGTELSPEEQLRVLLAFAKDVKKQLDTNAQNASAAVAAPAPTASAP